MVLLAVLLVAADLAYLLLIYGSLKDVVFCCDAYQYLLGASELQRKGLTADVYLAGYRSVVAYTLIGWVHGFGTLLFFVGGGAAAETPGGAYAAGAIAFHLLGGFGLIALRSGKPGFSWYSRRPT